MSQVHHWFGSVGSRHLLALSLLLQAHGRRMAGLVGACEEIVTPMFVALHQAPGHARQHTRRGLGLAKEGTGSHVDRIQWDLRS